MAFLVYSSVSSTVFRMFACDDLDDGFSYLRADYATLCDSAKHEALKRYAPFMIGVYPVGIPLLYAIMLFRDRDVLRDGDRRACKTSLGWQSTAGLWRPYTPSRFYYELVECARRVALTGIIVFTFPNTAAQVATTNVLGFIFILVSWSLDPYVSDMDTWLSRVGHAVVFLSFFQALLAKVDVSGEREYSAEVFGGVLIAVNVLMVLAVAMEAVYLLRASFRKNCDDGDNSNSKSVRADSFPRKVCSIERKGVPGPVSALYGDSDMSCEEEEV